MQRTYLTSIAGILLLLFFLPGCDSSDNNDDRIADIEVTANFSYQIDVVEQTMVHLENVNGRIEIEGIPEATTITISGERRVRSFSRRDAEDYLRRVIVNIDERSDVVFIRTEQPDSRDGREFGVEYKITMPTDLAAEVLNINGEVAVHDVLGGTEVSVINGRILCTALLPSEGAIDLSVINGVIELEIPENSSAELIASVTNGNISTFNLSLSDPIITSRSLRGTLGDGGIQIRLSAVNGDIVIRGLAV